MRKQRHISYTHCPVEAALDIIGGKWKSILLFRILEGTRRFNELRRLQPSLTPRMLATQLRELHRDGLIARTVYAEVPPKVEYSITEFGRTLEPVLLALTKWAEKHMLPRIVGQASVAPGKCPPAKAPLAPRAGRPKRRTRSSASQPEGVKAKAV